MLVYNGITKKEVDEIFERNNKITTVGNIIEVDTVFTKYGNIVIMDNDKLMIPDGCEDKIYVMMLDEDDKYRIKNIIKYSFRFYHDDDFNLKDLEFLKYGKRNYYVNKIPIFDVRQIKDLGKWVIKEVLGDKGDNAIEEWLKLIKDINKEEVQDLDRKFKLSLGNYKIVVKVKTDIVG